MKKQLMTLLVICLLSTAFVSGDNVLRKDNDVYTSGSEAVSIAVSETERIVVNAAGTLSGQIKIVTGGDMCTTEYVKRIKTSSEAEAKSYAGLVTVECDRRNGEVVVSLRAPAGAPWSGTNNSVSLLVTLTVPDNSAISIATAYFDIEAFGPFREFNVTESLSQVSVDNVVGSADIKVSNRPLIVRNLVGKLSATNKYGRIKLHNIKTGEETATILNDNGDIQMDGFIGELEVSTSYSEIIAERLTLTGSRNRIKNVSAPITLMFDSLTDGRLRVNNHYGPIHVECKGEVDAAFICKIGEESTINAEGFEMEPTLVYDDRLEFDVGTAKAEVRLTARGDGNIIILGPNR
ncbi:MAG: hypothetical protein R3F48_16565 [Candidatus Zixiibacteriota bacterium]